MFWSPKAPTAPSGNRMYVKIEKIAAARSAFAVSRAGSWYSGAKVAQHSKPYDDQHIRYSHVITRRRPLPLFQPAPRSMLLCRFDVLKSPVMYGAIIVRNSGKQSAPAVTYPVQTAGRMPNTFATQIATITTAPTQMAGLELKSMPKIRLAVWVPQVALEKNCTCSR